MSLYLLLCSLWPNYSLLLCFSDPICLLIPLSTCLASKEPAKLYKRLLLVARGAVLVLRTHRALSYIRRVLLLPLRTVPGLTLTRRVLPALTLTRRAVPGITPSRRALSRVRIAYPLPIRPLTVLLSLLKALNISLCKALVPLLPPLLYY